MLSSGRRCEPPGLRRNVSAAWARSQHGLWTGSVALTLFLGRRWLPSPPRPCARRCSACWSAPRRCWSLPIPEAQSASLRNISRLVELETCDPVQVEVICCYVGQP